MQKYKIQTLVAHKSTGNLKTDKKLTIKQKKAIFAK